MSHITDNETAIQTLVDQLFRHKAGQLVATLTRLFGVDKLELAEDVVQETLITALKTWSYHGIPANPGGWLMQAAKNRALDILRREVSFRNKAVLLADGEEYEGELDSTLDFEQSLGDDHLTMIFLCCHPCLSQEAQMALTLKTVGGFGVSEIARAFLSTEPTIAQRLVRAKRRLRDENVTFEMPPDPELSHRLDTVLTILYLLFNEGYGTHQGKNLVRQDLCTEAIYLCSVLLAHPLGQQTKVHALLALMLLHFSRLEARTDAEGNLLLLSEQERTLWDKDTIYKGLYHLAQAGQGNQLSEYHLQAGIAACHAVAENYESTEWATILAYYNALTNLNPSPLIKLNRAVALAMVQGASFGIAELEKLKNHPQLSTYYLLPATLGELYQRNGDKLRALQYYGAALSLTTNETEQRFLFQKINQCERN